MKDRQVVDKIVEGGGYIHSLFFQQIISLENLFAAWREFRKGKTSKQDVQEFEWRLEDNIFSLYEDLGKGVYHHGTYESFYVHDPKRRHIHKPPVRDRLLHHAIFRVIEPFFERMILNVRNVKRDWEQRRLVEIVAMAWLDAMTHRRYFSWSEVGNIDACIVYPFKNSSNVLYYGTPTGIELETVRFLFWLRVIYEF